MGVGGDGFYSRIDPVGTGSSLRFWQGNNSGMLHRCVSNCTAQNAPWSGNVSAWGGDTQSFILPYDLFHGGLPGGDDCPAAGVPGGCGHLIAGTTRVWETIAGGNSTFTSSNWYITNNPTNQNMTKQTLGNRSFINQVKYSPKYQSVAIVGTNDANLWIGFNLGTGTASQANWVDVTGSNAVLPNRPVLGVALDPTVPAAGVPVGYAAVGGFNANTPATPGHVFQVTCASACGSFTWLNKTGNLPDIPVDSIIANPKFPQQVFAGSDWGLYYTNDITAASPVWFRFEDGLSHAMIWDMQIDRGATTLSLWTRSRGAYVWPLPSGPVPSLTPTSVVSRKTHGGAGTFDINLPLTGNVGVECRSGGATNDYQMIINFATPVTVGGASVTSGTGSVSSFSVSGSQVTVNLTGVTNVQRITVTLSNVNDGIHMGNVPVSMGVLIGDVNGNAVVNASDVSLTKSQVGQAVSGSNFREDVNVNGTISATDVALVKSKVGTALP